MNEKLVIIFAFVLYAFHGIVDGSAITPGPPQRSTQECYGEECTECQEIIGLQKAACIIGWYNGMCKPCAETGKLT